MHTKQGGKSLARVLNMSPSNMFLMIISKEKVTSKIRSMGPKEEVEGITSFLYQVFYFLIFVCLSPSQEFQNICFHRFSNTFY